MLFDIGWPELLLVGVVALVVIGPKDLPRALRVAGFWVRKARTLSREFQSSIDQMIREAELEEIRQDLNKATQFDIEKEFKETIDPTGELAESIKPPEIPDFFDDAPHPAAVGETPAVELDLLPPGESEEQLSLPLPGEPENSIAAPAPDHQPAAPKSPQP